MKGVAVVPAAIWTASGAGLAAMAPGAFAWWDPVWVLLLVLAAHIGLVARGGLGPARFCAGITLAVFMACGILAAASGRVAFGGPGFFRIGGVLALMPPLFAFALLVVCHGAAGCLFPFLRPRVLAAFTAFVFVFTVWNGAGFLSVERQWWIAVPGPLEWPVAAGALVALGLLAWGLAFLQPADTRMHRSRWSPEAGLLLVMNAVFGVARAGAGGGA